MPPRSRTCERCGSDNIQFVEDRDDSVGYSVEEWRCMRCGMNCEYWVSLAQPACAGEPATIQESDKTRTLTTINKAKEFASVVLLLP